MHHAAELLAKPAAKPAAKGEKAGGPKGARSAYMFFCDGARDTIKGEPPVAAGALRLPTAACTTKRLRAAGQGRSRGGRRGGGRCEVDHCRGTRPEGGLQYQSLHHQRASTTSAAAADHVYASVTHRCRRSRRTRSR